MEKNLESIIYTGKKIMQDNIFYGYFLAMLDKGIDNERVPTAGVKMGNMGPELIVNTDFWGELNETEAKAILTHELLHVMFGHLTDHSYYNDKKMLNLAKDLEINQLITGLPYQTMPQKEFLKFVEDNKEKIINGEMKLPIRPVLFEDFGFNPTTEAHKGTRYYYEELVKKSQKNDQLGKNIRQYSDQCDAGVKHVFMHDWKDFEELGEEEKELLQNQVKSYIKKIAEENEKNTDWGNLPGYLRELISDLLKHRPPVVSWKYYFRKLIAKSIDYFIKATRVKPNKRIEENPTLKFEQKLKIFVGLDTSGSMSDEDITQCFTEIHHFYKTGNQIIVGECDAHLNEKEDVYEYKGKYPTKRLGISGGGGTSMVDLIKHVNKNKKIYSTFIYLTDGYMAPPDILPQVPTIIVLTKTGSDPKKMKENNFPGVIIKMN